MRPRSSRGAARAVLAVATLPLAGIMGLATSGPAGADTAAGYSAGFEDGGTAGWTGEAGTQVANSVAVAHSGSHSLQVSGITAYGRGALLRLGSAGLARGVWYDLRAAVRLPGGAAPTPLAFTAVSGVLRQGFTVPVSTNFQLETGDAWSDQLAQQVPYAPPSAHFQWDGVSAQVVFRLGPVAGCPAAEPATPPAAFWLDDASLQRSAVTSQITAIAGRCDPPSPATTTTTTTTSSRVLSSDFEDGTTQGWHALGGTTLSVVTDPATGNHRLRISGITAPGQGAAYDVSPPALADGTRYTARGTGRLTAGENPGVFALHEESVPEGARWDEALYPDQRGDGWLETNFTWAAGAPPLQLQLVALRSCPGTALPSTVEVDDLGLWAGGNSVHMLAGCPPATTTTTTTTTTAGGCTADYRVESQWDGGFQGTVTVHAGAAAVGGWTVSWQLAPGQGVTQAWNTVLGVTGSTVTARNTADNGRLAAGASTSFGFLGRWSGSNPVPVPACTAG